LATDANLHSVFTPQFFGMVIEKQTTASMYNGETP